jgi:haloalkane dehalogenase
MAAIAGWDRLRRWDEPFLVAFSDGDPITGGMAAIPADDPSGAAGLDRPVLAECRTLREEAGELLAAEIVSFITNHPPQSRP